jgi:hypothetical protein
MFKLFSTRIVLGVFPNNFLQNLSKCAGDEKLKSTDICLNDLLVQFIS